jgi:hypothetical protein
MICLCYSGCTSSQLLYSSIIKLHKSYICRSVSVLVWLRENGTENYSAWSSVGDLYRVQQ